MSISSDFLLITRLTLAMFQALFGNSSVIRLAPYCFSIRKF